MSQAKVDRYKEEKKNRAKIMKRNKIKKVVAVIVAALGLGALLGIPLGKFIYGKQKEIEAAKATIVSSDYSTWFEKEWAGKYSDLFTSSQDLQDLIDEFNSTATDADAEEDEDFDDADIEYLDDEDFDDADIEYIDDADFEIEE